jgi:ribosomal protein L3 glutamine methyltransferase
LFAGQDFSLVRDANAVGRVLDLCTGSGCLAILAAMRFANAMVDAVELSKDALQVAKRNVAQHRMRNRVRLLQGDLFAPVEGRRYDLIVSNPPYVDDAGMKRLPPECRHEPRMAFDGGKDGLAIVRRIIDEAGWFLTPRGGLLCEIGRGRDVLERAYPDKRFLWLDTEDSFDSRGLPPQADIRADIIFVRSVPQADIAVIQSPRRRGREVAARLLSQVPEQP